MDKTVILLIGAGVSCVVIGIALFIKLCSMKRNEDDDSDSKKLLDKDYLDNFNECFENTGNIEDALEQLANIYTGNQYMYNLIVSAIDYIRDEQGDYETALEKINVDEDVDIMKAHNRAIRKTLNFAEDEKSNNKSEDFDEDFEEAKQESIPTPKAKPEPVEDFDEDFEELRPEPVSKPKSKQTVKKIEKKKEKKIISDFIEYGSEEDDDDNGFKI